MLTFIHDKEELKKFFDIILPPLNNEEVYFVSMSARNKQLTEDERLFYDLGRTEMFERKIIREKDWMNFFRTIRKFEMHEEGITGRLGVPLPPHCLILYLNINPCNMIMAWRKFQDEMTENVFNLVSGRGSDPAFFKRMNRLMMNAVQTSKGTKHYIDIDIDFIDKEKASSYEFVNLFTKEFADRGVEYFVVSTKGGFHILLKKSTLKFNYNELVENWNQPGPVYGIKEVTVNKNDMIPIPGTLQAGYPVTVWWEMSNYKEKD